MFKNFRSRRAHNPQAAAITVAQHVRELVSMLESDKNAAASVPVALRIRVQELLPVEIKRVLQDQFEFDLAYAVARRMHKELTAKFGLLESRWPNMHPHVVGYTDLVRMIEAYLSDHPEAVNVEMA